MTFVKVATTLYGEEHLSKDVAWKVIKRVEYYLGKAGVKWEEE